MPKLPAEELYNRIFTDENFQLTTEILNQYSDEELEQSGIVGLSDAENARELRELISAKEKNERLDDLLEEERAEKEAEDDRSREEEEDREYEKRIKRMENEG